MKKISGLLLSAVMLTSVSTFAQNATTTTSSSNTDKKVRKPSRDYVMLQLTHDRWANTPEDVNVGGFGRGVGLYICYDFPIKTSNFSFAAGVGVSSSNIFFKDQLPSLTASSDAIKFTTLTDEASANIKGQKFTTTSLEFPLELRYFSDKENRNTGFKAAIGVKVGYAGIGGTHVKYKESLSGQWVTQKEGTKRFMEQWRMAPTVRIGYGNISLVGTYYVTRTFKEGAGPEVNPYQIGICISGL